MCNSCWAARLCTLVHPAVGTLCAISSSVSTALPQEWENVSQEAKILVKELLTMDPENRHTAEKTLRSRCWLCPSPPPPPSNYSQGWDSNIPPSQCQESPCKLS